MFLKNSNIISKIKRSKVTDYAALREILVLKRDAINEKHYSFKQPPFDDPDEMKHYAAFHQCLHYLLRFKQSAGTFFCFVLLLYVPSQQLWSLRDGQFT